LRRSFASIDGTVVGDIEEIGIYQIHIPDSEDLTLLKEVINDLEDNSSIKLVSPNIELHENKTPDEDKDPAWDEGNPGDSWDEDNPGGNNWGLEFIKAPSAWDISTGSSDVKIGIIDMGFDIDHECVIWH